MRISRTQHDSLTVLSLRHQRVRGEERDDKGKVEQELERGVGGERKRLLDTLITERGRVDRAGKWSERFRDAQTEVSYSKRIYAVSYPRDATRRARGMLTGLVHMECPGTGRSSQLVSR